MITDIIQGLNSNHKVQCSMLKVQRINSSMFNVQISKENEFKGRKRFVGLEKFVVGV